jgi:hypothetical protein
MLSLSKVQDLEEMREVMEKRISTLESDKVVMQAMIGNKSNKASVATALHRKANKKDIEEEFERIKALIEETSRQGKESLAQEGQEKLDKVESDIKA